jgi:hypothetical protein
MPPACFRASLAAVCSLPLIRSNSSVAAAAAHSRCLWCLPPPAPRPQPPAPHSALCPLLSTPARPPRLPPASIRSSPPCAHSSTPACLLVVLSLPASAPLPSACRPHVFEPPSPPYAHCPSSAVIRLWLLPPHILVASGACPLQLHL